MLDWSAFIPRHDGPDTLFYVDPPYWGCEDDYGKQMFAREDFQRLADQLGGIRGRFILWLNDVPEVREIFAAFHLDEVKTTYTIGHQSLKALAALQGKTIKQYALERLFPGDTDADLRRIVRYTRKERGVEQVRTEVAKLKVGIARVATGQGVFKEPDAFYPALRMARCEHH